MVFDNTIVSVDSQNTRLVGKTLAQSIIAIRKSNGQAPRIFCLHGDLGSGKTTFTQGFASGLGISSRVTSPTFLIVRRLEIPNTNGFLYHIDLYRLQESFTFKELGIHDALQDIESFIIIEWPEKAKNMIPSSCLDIYFATQENGSHTIAMNYTF